MLSSHFLPIDLPAAAAAHGSQSSLTSTTPIANSVADALLLYAALANTSYPDAEAPRILSLPKRLLQLQERCAANEDYVLGSGQPLKGMKVGMCKQVRGLCFLNPWCFKDRGSDSTHTTSVSWHGMATVACAARVL